MPQVLDYSAGFPGAANIKRAGYIGAVRYIGTPGNIKCATAAELRDFTASGLGMALVFEQYATDWRGGYNAGAANARRAVDHARVIGWPVGSRPIYMAVDQDVVSESEFASAMSYLRGAASVLGAEWVGVYGEHDVCARAAAEGAARWFWQCRAWSGTPPRLYPGRHLYQHAGYVTVGGIQCDYNDVLRDDWGQHSAGGDDCMGIFDERSKAAYDAVFNTIVSGSLKDSQLRRDLGHIVTRLEQESAATRAVVAEAIAHPDITPEEMARFVSEAVAAHTPTADQMAASLLPLVKQVVGDVLDEDNADQAAEIVRLLAERLATQPE